MINSRRNFIKNLTFGLVSGGVLSTIPTSTFAENYEDGIEINKGYIVFNKNTQNVMEALSEALLPGSKNIGMKGKVMNYIKSDRGAATTFDAGLWNLDAVSQSKYKKHFYEISEKEKINKLLKHISSRNAVFFRQFRYLVIRLYYSDSDVWKLLSYNGPPQTKGFMNYSKAPKD